MVGEGDVGELGVVVEVEDGEGAESVAGLSEMDFEVGLEVALGGAEGGDAGREAVLGEDGVEDGGGGVVLEGGCDGVDGAFAERSAGDGGVSVGGGEDGVLGGGDDGLVEFGGDGSGEEGREGEGRLWGEWDEGGAVEWVECGEGESVLVWLSPFVEGQRLACGDEDAAVLDEGEEGLSGLGGGVAGTEGDEDAVA